MISSKPEFYQMIIGLNIKEVENKKIKREIIKLLVKRNFKIPKNLNSFLEANLNYSQSKTAFIHDISMKIFECSRQNSFRN